MVKSYASSSELLHELHFVKDRLEPLFSADAATLQRRYAPGKWTISELLHHIVDAESVMYERIRRTLAEQPKPVLWGFWQDHWETAFDYRTYPVTLRKNLFVGTRDNILYLVEKFYDTHGALQFVHSETGLRTLRDEMDKISWHSLHHWRQIEQALAS